MSDTGNTIERVELDEQLPRAARIPLPVRVLGVGVAAAMFLTPLLVIYGIVDSLRGGDWSGVGTMAAFAGAMATAAATWGRKILRAVRTGVDPDGEKRVLEEASSRALLAAVQRTAREEPRP